MTASERHPRGIREAFDQSNDQSNDQSSARRAPRRLHPVFQCITPPLRVGLLAKSPRNLPAEAQARAGHVANVPTDRAAAFLSGAFLSGAADQGVATDRALLAARVRDVRLLHRVEIDPAACNGCNGCHTDVGTLHGCNGCNGIELKSTMRRGIRPAVSHRSIDDVIWRDLWHHVPDWTLHQPLHMQRWRHGWRHL